MLVRHFVHQFNRQNNRNVEIIPTETMGMLVRYPWPGNIRELQNIVERAVILSRGPVLQVPVRDLQSGSPATSVREKNLRSVLEETERTQILKALEACNGLVAGPRGAAARLGMKRTTLQLRMQKLGIQLSRRVVSKCEALVN